MEYGPIDVENAAKTPLVPIKEHFTYRLISRDLGRFRTSPLVQMFMRLVPFAVPKTLKKSPMRG